jgi:hypothetical protein
MNNRVDNILIPTYGYVTTYTEDKLTKLYGSENGLGLEIVPEHGINNLTYIQFDISELISNVSYKTLPKITITNGMYKVTGSAIQGRMGSTLYTSTKIDNTYSIPIPYFGTYRYISITASETSIIKIKSIEFEIEVENITYT